MLAKQDMDIVDHMCWRYATQTFDATKKIDSATWNKLEEALILTPSSWGLQPWKFVVITDDRVKAKLTQYTRGQLQPADCSQLLVICRVNDITSDYVQCYVNRMAVIRNIEIGTLDAEKMAMLQSIEADRTNGITGLANELEKQCYIALGVLITAAALWSR
jgi:nitroreductase